MKSKCLVTENVSELSPEMGQLVRKVLDKEYKTVDIMDRFMFKQPEEITARIAAVEDIFIETTFANIDQLNNMIKLLQGLTKAKKCKYNIHILMDNRFLGFLNTNL